MNELQNIAQTFAGISHRGESAALATVVSVEGSAYRRPGARMLIDETGQTTGSISGGCLERDVAERARQVIGSGVPEIVTYDTRGDDDLIWGLGLGCNGVVKVLLEPITANLGVSKLFPFTDRCLDKDQAGIVATVIGSNRTTPSGDPHSFATIGDRVCFPEEELRHTSSMLRDGFAERTALIDRLMVDARAVLQQGNSSVRAYDDLSLIVFFDLIRPPRQLVIFGAESDALPLVHMAKATGRCVTVVDVRARPASIERFAEADHVILCRPEDVAQRLDLRADLAAVIMTHSYFADAALLKYLLRHELPYLGILGPKIRTERLVDELHSEGVNINQRALDRLHAPIGIDIGAETAEEIAMSILTEIKAVESRRGAGFLKDHDGAIHSHTERPSPEIVVEHSDGSPQDEVEPLPSPVDQGNPLLPLATVLGCANA